MKARGEQLYLVRSSKPPTVEIDTEVKAAYVRFSSAPVSKTKEVPSKSTWMATIDLDAKGQVVGVELLGVDCFEIKVLLKVLPVTVTHPEILGRTRYISARAARSERTKDLLCA